MGKTITLTQHNKVVNGLVTLIVLLSVAVTLVIYRTGGLYG